MMGVMMGSADVKQLVADHSHAGTADGGTNMLIGGGDGLLGRGDLGWGGYLSCCWSSCGMFCCSMVESMQSMAGAVAISMSAGFAGSWAVSGARKLTDCMG